MPLSVKHLGQTFEASSKPCPWTDTAEGPGLCEAVPRYVLGPLEKIGTGSSHIVPYCDIEYLYTLSSYYIIYGYIWWFPEIGVPPVIIHFWLGFSFRNHPLWGTPIDGNPKTTSRQDSDVAVELH